MNTPSLITQSKLLLAAAATICTLLPAAVLGGPAVLDSAINPANGHTYYLLANSDWTDAENAAIGLGGHLATIRSLAENNWIWNRWGTNRDLWIGLYDPVMGDGGGAQHAANFVWTSGETNTYRNWNLSTGEPTGDKFAYIWAKGLVAGSGGVDFGTMRRIPLNLLPSPRFTGWQKFPPAPRITPRLRLSYTTILSWEPPSRIPAAVIRMLRWFRFRAVAAPAPRPRPPSPTVLSPPSTLSTPVRVTPMRPKL